MRPSKVLVIDPPVIAHRGASYYAPENTLSAFSKAKELGVHWVEFDVMLTQDNEVVVIHDESLDRTTDATGLVSQCLYDFIKTVDAGSWFGASFAHEKIPTLREVIVLLNQLKLSANIEIKAQTGNEEVTVHRVLQVIHDVWQHHAQFCLSSFSLPILRCIRQQSRSVLLGFLMDEWEEEWQEKCDELQAATVNVNHEILNFDRIQSIKSSHRLLLGYTVNDGARARELLSLGVDAIFSDVPDRMIKEILV